MRIEILDFELPPERIADHPVEPRDAARLLVYRRADRSIAHHHVRDLPELLGAGDLLVANDTKVLPHRLLGERPGGGRAECLVLSRDGTACEGYLRPARKARLGVAWRMEGGALELRPTEVLGGGRFRFGLATPGGGDPGEELLRVGRAPLPPYIQRDDRADPAADRERYQTVYARVPGAVAAPTAGLHFTEGLLAQLEGAGVERAHVTLHVGEGTFKPIEGDDAAQHEMHSEWFELPAATADAVARCRVRGGRVVALGTTSCRTLESSAAGKGLVDAGSGDTKLFLYPGKEIQVVDALFTNFHLPRSTLMLLVAAFLGREETLRVYGEAISAQYRFYSYGDAMLVL